jgi:hypothetical protein
MMSRASFTLPFSLLTSHSSLKQKPLRAKRGGVLSK